MDQQHIQWIIQSVPVESTWTRHEDRLFEAALVDFPEGTDGRWQKIAAAVQTKTAEQVTVHFEALWHDIEAIESGRVQLPVYPEDVNESFVSRDPVMPTNHISFGNGKGSKHGEGERKKGTPWTEEEHRKFLEGLAKYGKGDWRSISRNAVITRTPTQVASHAQKYFLRQNSLKKERKRSSIHDITTEDAAMLMPPPPPPNNFNGDQQPGHGGAPPHMGYGYPQNFGF